MIIFLDIDGVLVHAGMYSGRLLITAFDKKCITILNNLCKQLNAKIVISSTWRVTHHPQDIQKILEDKGFTGEVIGETPHIGTGHRGEEIKQWIRDNEYAGDYVVIDDEIVDMENIPQEKILYVKNGWRCGGLKKAHVDNFMKRKENGTTSLD